jgi:hypothetical protein
MAGPDEYLVEPGYGGYRHFGGQGMLGQIFGFDDAAD